MSKKPKRIRAAVLFTDSDGTLWKERVPGTERAYLLRQSDIRALAEQFVRSSARFYGESEEVALIDPRSVDAALAALKDAGMTPGKAGAK